MPILIENGDKSQIPNCNVVTGRSRAGNAFARLTGRRAANQDSPCQALPFQRGHKGFSPCPKTLCQSLPSGFCHSAFYLQCFELSQPGTVTAIKRNIPPAGKLTKTIRTPGATSPLLNTGINSQTLPQPPGKWVTTAPSTASLAAVTLMSQSQPGLTMANTAPRRQSECERILPGERRCWEENESRRGEGGNLLPTGRALAVSISQELRLSTDQSIGPSTRGSCFTPTSCKPLACPSHGFGAVLISFTQK